MINKYQYTVLCWDPDAPKSGKTVKRTVLANNRPEAVEKLLLVQPDLQIVDIFREKAPE